MSDVREVFNNVIIKLEESSLIKDRIYFDGTYNDWDYFDIVIDELANGQRLCLSYRHGGHVHSWKKYWYLNHHDGLVLTDRRIDIGFEKAMDLIESSEVKEKILFNLDLFLNEYVNGKM